MRYINLARQSGKSLMLIHTSYITGDPIIVYDRARAEILKQQAQQIGLDIEVLSLEEFIKIKKLFDGVLIDEVTDFIEKALNDALGVKVIAGTLSLPMIEPLKQNKEV